MEQLFDLTEIRKKGRNMSLLTPAPDASSIFLSPQNLYSKHIVTKLKVKFLITVAWLLMFQAFCLIPLPSSGVVKPIPNFASTTPTLAVRHVIIQCS